MEQPERSSATQAYPLTALFVLMAACSVVCAQVTPVARSVMSGGVGIEEAVSASAVGSIVVTVIGALVGLYHYRRVRGLLWGILTGAAIGSVVGPVALAPSASFPSIISTAVFGSALLVALGATFGLFARLGGSPPGPESPFHEDDP